MAGEPGGIPAELIAEVEAVRQREEKAWVTRLTVLALSLPFGFLLLVLIAVLLPKLAGAALPAQVAALAPWAKNVIAFLGKAVHRGGKLVALPVVIVIAIVSVPKRRFVDAFSRTLLPRMAAAHGFGISRSAAALSRLRTAAGSAMPYGNISRVTIDPKLVICDTSGRTDLLACNLVAHQRSLRRWVLNKGQDELMFSGIAVVASLPCRASGETTAMRSSFPGGWGSPRFAKPENGSAGLPEKWKWFGELSDADDLPCRQLIATVAGACEKRCDRQSLLAVHAFGDALVVLIDTRDRLLSGLRPERTGGLNAIIAVVDHDLETLKAFADAVASVSQAALSSPPSVPLGHRPEDR